MAAARLCWLRLLVCSALLITGKNGQDDVCAGKKKIACGRGFRLVGGACVNMKPFTINARGKLKNGETVCLKEVKIKRIWFYPENHDICNLDECFCYCNKKNYFVTVFFPTVVSLPRVRNNQGILVAGKHSKCWCHNNIKKAFRSANYPVSDCGGSDSNAIVVFNGCSASARAATYKNLYNCARFEPSSRSQGMRATGGLLPFSLGKRSSTKQCLRKQKCYAPSTPLRTSMKMKAASQVECYCKCSKDKYFMAAWIGTKTRGRCKCFNSRVKGRKRSCGDSRQLRVKYVKARRNKQHVCCRALTEQRRKKKPSKKPKAKKKKPPTKTKKARPSSRSEAVKTSGPPSLGGTPPKKKPAAPSSRSSPVPAQPPNIAPSSRSSPIATSGLPPLGGPPAQTPAPKKPTVGISEEPDFVVPDDVQEPTTIILLPPYQPDFWDTVTEPPPPNHLIDLYLPDEPKQPHQPPTDVWDIVDLIFLDYPPDIPQDVLFFDEPMYHNLLPPLIYDDPYPYQYPEDPDTVMMPPFPPHTWMLGDDWDPYMPDMTEFTPSSFNEPAAYYE